MALPVRTVGRAFCLGIRRKLAVSAHLVLRPRALSPIVCYFTEAGGRAWLLVSADGRHRGHRDLGTFRAGHSTSSWAALFGDRETNVMALVDISTAARMVIKVWC